MPAFRDGSEMDTGQHWRMNRNVAIWRNEHHLRDIHPIVVKIVFLAFEWVTIDPTEVTPDGRFDDAQYWDDLGYPHQYIEWANFLGLIKTVIDERRHVQRQDGALDRFPHISIKDLLSDLDHIWRECPPREGERSVYLGGFDNRPAVPFEKRRRKHRGTTATIIAGWLLFLLLSIFAYDQWLLFPILMVSNLIFSLWNMLAGLVRRNWRLLIFFTLQFATLLLLATDTPRHHYSYAYFVLWCMYTLVGSIIYFGFWLASSPYNYPWECAKCGYLLLGLKSSRCPECGREFDPGLVFNE